MYSTVVNCKKKYLIKKYTRTQVFVALKWKSLVSGITVLAVNIPFHSSGFGVREFGDCEQGMVILFGEQTDGKAQHIFTTEKRCSVSQRFTLNVTL